MFDIAMLNVTSISYKGIPCKDDYFTNVKLSCTVTIFSKMHLTWQGTKAPQISLFDN